MSDHSDTETANATAEQSRPVLPPMETEYEASPRTLHGGLEQSWWASLTTPLRVRLVVAVCLAIGALSIFLGVGPEQAYEDTRTSIEAGDDANNATTEGAPQQAVVNGWTTIEYLNLLSKQQEQSDDRRDGLLFLLVLAAAAALATGRSRQDA